MSGAVRRLAREIADGFHAGLSVLLWGWPYPRRLDNATVEAVRKSGRNR